jgi:hypothetical protein
MKTLTEVRNMSRDERQDYVEQLKSTRKVISAGFVMEPLRSKRQIGFYLDYRWASDVFPLRKSKYLDLKLEENNILNGSIVARDLPEDDEPTCEMSWHGYVSSVYDGEFYLMAYEPDAKITGTLHDAETKESFTFSFDGVEMVGDTPKPYFLVLIDARKHK